ncbi:MAG TPA: carboxylesterase family protein, partial [Trebonia sp.]|nr:carboxylesterase family protein [Trebonia sp.]
LLAGAGGAAASPGAAAGSPGASPGTDRALVVPTADGLVQGKASGTMDEYLGIPYAAPPVGALRWQPPRPAAPWRGVREATAFAPHCPQPASPFGVASASENCLYLNVFAPAGARAANLPVMVWIHGGSLLVGESDDFNPAPLVRHGVVVVTINYRLGALGFLADAALAGQPGGSSGDYGLMDQQAALRWVQRSIRGFGGDPRNVTLFGESAGGASTLAQLVSPGARGLFQRAVVESGTYELTQQSQASAESSGAAFAAKVGCSGSDTAIASCLRGLPVSTIVDNEDTSGYDPTIDDSVLPRSIGTALASGQFNHVPVVLGTNRDEYRLFVGLAEAEGDPPVTAANYDTYIAGVLGVSASTAAEIADEYPVSAYSSPAVALGAVGTDAIFACHALTAEDDLSRYVPTYAYEFNDENAPDRSLPMYGFPYGAAHSFELQYLFDLSNTPYPGTLSASQQLLSRAMTRDWTNLAKTGVPAAGWPRWAAADQRTLSLVPPSPQLETDYAAEHHCSFWNAVS